MYKANEWCAVCGKRFCDEHMNSVDTVIVKSELTDLKKEIAKKDRMIEKACKRLSMTNMSIRTEKQWLAWLEKEAQGVE